MRVLPLPASRAITTWQPFLPSSSVRGGHVSWARPSWILDEAVGAGEPSARVPAHLALCTHAPFRHVPGGDVSGARGCTNSTDPYDGKWMVPCNNNNNNGDARD